MRAMAWVVWAAMRAGSGSFLCYLKARPTPSIAVLAAASAVLKRMVWGSGGSKASLGFAWRRVLMFSTFWGLAGVG